MAAADPLDALERFRPLVDDWAAFAEVMRSPLPACVWANPLRATPARLAALLEAAGAGPQPLTWRPGAFRLADGSGIGNYWWYMIGLAHAQEEASLLSAHMLDARPGHRVLDLCAAPGGKTAEIALALGNRGSVVANDVSLPRLRALRGNLDRLGLINVSVTRRDGSGYPREAGRFDRVLVDAPCSGAGTLRRRAGRTAWMRETSERVVGWQLALLRKALRLCRPGGRIVYSTCTFAPEENEAVVNAVLREADGALRVLPVEVPGLVTSPGVTRWQGADYDGELCHAARLWPHINDTGGFFAVALERSGKESGDEADGVALEPLPRTTWSETAMRYGLERAFDQRMVAHRLTARGLHVAAADHRPPSAPAPEAVGMRVTTAKSAQPRLTTAGAVLLGGEATRNVVELDGMETAAYLRREELASGAGRRIGCEGGIAVVRHDGLGLGNLIVDRAGRLQSMFPRRWGGGPA